MSIQKTIIMVNIVLAGVVCSLFAHEDHELSRAAVVELALHRLEKLVNLKKIDASFQSKLKSLTLSALPKTNPKDPGFYAVIEQYPAEDGTKNQLELWFVDKDLPPRWEHKVTLGGVAQGAPSWPDRDAVTLAEMAFHYLLDEWEGNPELAPYNKRVEEVTLLPGVNSAGEAVAQVDLKISKENQEASEPALLRILVKLNGEFDSYVLIPQQKEE